MSRRDFQHLKKTGVRLIKSWGGKCCMPFSLSSHPFSPKLILLSPWTPLRESVSIFHKVSGHSRNYSAIISFYLIFIFSAKTPDNLFFGRVLNWNEKKIRFFLTLKNRALERWEKLAKFGKRENWISLLWPTRILWRQVAWRIELVFCWINWVFAWHHFFYARSTF